MARFVDSKCQQCRREGKKLFLKGERCHTSKCALVKRNYIPGIHGPKLGRGKRLTGYGEQLREKQTAKRTYGLLERQFRNYFDKAINRTGDTGENLFKLLEMRFDNAVYRSGLASSRAKARQLVNHGHLLVNDKKVDIPSYQLKAKDKISIREKSRELAPFKALAEELKNKECPDWLILDPKDLTVVIADAPSVAKNKPGFDLKLITEFYSRQ